MILLHDEPETLIYSGVGTKGVANRHGLDGDCDRKRNGQEANKQMKARRVVLSSKTTHIGRVRKHSSGRRRRGRSRSITGDTCGPKRPTAKTVWGQILLSFCSIRGTDNRFTHAGAWYKYEPERRTKGQTRFFNANRLNNNFRVFLFL